MYVSSVDTRAQSNDLEPVSVAAEAENRSKTLSYQTERNGPCVWQIVASPVSQEEHGPAKIIVIIAMISIWDLWLTWQSDNLRRG